MSVNTPKDSVESKDLQVISEAVWGTYEKPFDVDAVSKALVSTAAVNKSFVTQVQGGPVSNTQEPIDENNPGNDIMKAAGILIPPYDSDVLCAVAENSSALGPNIDAYVINIDSYGHTFKPTIDLNSPDADEKIKEALWYEFKLEPTPKEVQAKKKELTKEIADERQKLEAFFDSCGIDLQFAGPEGLRGLTRKDLETTGNAYWEILRDQTGEVAGFNRLPARSMRMTWLDDKPTQSIEKRKTSLFTIKPIPVTKRFRRYVQNYGGRSKYIYFKEFGDPRVISCYTGRVYDTEEAMLEAEQGKDVQPATEIVHFKISSPRSEYGIPRWIGVLLSVLGTRQAEEVNFMYFDNKSIPPLAVIVSGGRLTADTTQRLKDYIETEIHGRKNFHRVMVLESESAQADSMGSNSADPDNGRMKITLQPLTDAQQKDALFLQYDERNADKIGQVFRLPRLLRGDIRDFNRSTAIAALDFAEVQVFTPLRQAFDWMMNRLLLSTLGIRYHDFESQAATIRDPEALAKMIGDLTKANVLTPDESRTLCEDVFHRKLLKIDAEWTKQPIGITVSGRNQEQAKPGAGQQGQGAGALSVSGAGDTQEEVQAGHHSVDKAAIVARAIQKIHAYLLEEERKEYAEQLTKQEREVVKVPADKFATFATK